MAARHSNPLFLASLLALLAPLLALKVDNLERLHARLSEIKNKDFLDTLTSETNAGKDVTDESYQIPNCGGCIRDCSELPANSPSGLYVIRPEGHHILVVYCDMDEADGGWTVIQRNRHDTDITWSESWTTYKFGFGNIETDFWLGTEYIHQITTQKVYQVRFALSCDSKNHSFADYNVFSLEDESHGYKLRLGAYSGTAVDAMATGSSTSQDNMMFSTKDRDQDISDENCAALSGGGWWYSACYSVRLNFKGPLTWGDMCKGNVKASAILIKPLKC